MPQIPTPDSMPSRSARSAHTGRKPAPLGVLGGLGPGASARFYEAVSTRASDPKTGAFPRLALWNVSVTPQHEQAFVAGVAEPGHAAYREVHALLSEGVERLRRLGCDTLAMPCNTLQPLLETICEEQGIRNLSFIDAVAQRAQALGMRRVAVLATATSTRFDRYGEALAQRAIQPLALRANTQTELSQLLLRLMRGSRGERARLQQLCETLAPQIDGFVLACTDLSGHLESVMQGKPVIDSLELSIEQAVGYLQAQAAHVDSQHAPE